MQPLPGSCDQEGGDRGEASQCLWTRSLLDLSCHGTSFYNHFRLSPLHIESHVNAIGDIMLWCDSRCILMKPGMNVTGMNNAGCVKSLY